MIVMVILIIVIVIVVSGVVDLLLAIIGSVPLAIFNKIISHSQINISYSKSSSVFIKVLYLIKATFNHSNNSYSNNNNHSYNNNKLDFFHHVF
jgi:hypothetical protein